MQVKAKFRCYGKFTNGWGPSKTVHFHAVYGNQGDNASFSKSTPTGSLSMVIEDETSAADYFEEGKDYYLTFEKAPDVGPVV